MSELKTIDKEYIANTYARFPVELVCGKGSLVYDETGKEYVDMGSGIMFATTNIGAASPEDFGDFFAWGETTPKDSYSASNYNVTEFQDAACRMAGGVF